MEMHMKPDVLNILAMNLFFLLTGIPDKGVMRLRMVILSAAPSKPARTVLSSVTPVGIAIHLVRYTHIGKPSGVDEASMEMQVTDTWAGANKALASWAECARYFLCVAHKGNNCHAP